MRVVFVHGACVRDGSWWWHLAAAALQERGISSVAPALPSCGEADRPAGPHGPGLPEDVAAVRAVLTEGDDPIVVVAHSYGGIVAAEAAVGVKTVRHLVFVSSYLPEPGESLSTFGADVPPPFLDFDPDGGTFGVRPELVAETFVQDCPPDIARDAAALLVRQTLAVTQQPVRAAAWHDLPTTYLVCTEDRGTPAAAQREFSRRADKVIEVKAGHHPFLSQPQTVADIIASLSLRQVLHHVPYRTPLPWVSLLPHGVGGHDQSQSRGISSPDTVSRSCVRSSMSHQPSLMPRDLSLAKR